MPRLRDMDARGPEQADGSSRPECSAVDPDRADPPQGSKLWGYCKVLEFNDADTGGYEGVAEDGEPMLNFARKLHLDYKRRDAFPELPALSASAREGCEFCQLLKSATQKKYDEHMQDGNEPPWHFIHFDRASYEWWGLCLSWLEVKAETINLEESHTLLLTFAIEASSGKSSTWLKIRRRPFPPDALSTEHALMLKTWVSGCHEACQYPQTPPSLPTRLVDVGGRPGCREPRLVLSMDLTHASESQQEAYAALSHCWGKGRPPLETRDFSLQERLECIPIASLPSTFRDAVLVTRALGLRYIWIDSLCIIQNSKEDWERESQRMIHIYQCAYVTICALVGSCHDGFLQPQPAPLAVTIPFRSSIYLGICGSYRIRERYTHERRYRQFYDSEWNRRGWTFQEQLFSLRKLYCGDKFLAFNCGSKTHTADGMDNIEPSRGYVDRFSKVETRPREKFLKAAWYEYVEEYSGRLFTFREDRFPALSAVAQYVAERTEGQYLAGLWTADLHRGLIWHSVVPKDSGFLTETMDLEELIDTASRRPYVAPSWSWAYHIAGVKWHLSRPVHAECTVVEAHAEVDGFNPFGRINKSHLTINGKMSTVPGINLIQDRLRLYHCVRRVAYSLYSYVAVWLLDWAEVSPNHSACPPEAQLRKVGILLISSTKDDGATAWLEPPLGEDLLGFWGEAGRRFEILYGLLLYPTGERENEYRRVGMFLSSNREEGGRRFFDTCDERTVRII